MSPDTKEMFKQFCLTMRSMETSLNLQRQLIESLLERVEKLEKEKAND